MSRHQHEMRRAVLDALGAAGIKPRAGGTVQ
jgi:hypothetical protein